jgi:hypothetical protein
MPSRIARHAPLLAMIAALAYAVEGAIAIHAAQPDHDWNAWGYAVEISFAVALFTSIPLLPLLVSRSSRTAEIAIRVSQLGLAAMLIDAIASSAADGNVVGAVFFFGLLAALGGLGVAAGVSIKTRAGSWWLAPCVLAGLIAGMALGNRGGGIVIGVSWAVVALALHGSRRRLVSLVAGV